MPERDRGVSNQVSSAGVANMLDWQSALKLLNTGAPIVARCRDRSRIVVLETADEGVFRLQYRGEEILIYSVHGALDLFTELIGRDAARRALNRAQYKALFPIGSSLGWPPPETHPSKFRTSSIGSASAALASGRPAPRQSRAAAHPVGRRDRDRARPGC